MGPLIDPVPITVMYSPRALPRSRSEKTSVIIAMPLA